MRFADGELLLEDAHDLADFMVLMRKTVPPSRWVEDAVRRDELAGLAGVM